MIPVAIAIGSNLGNRERYLRDAAAALVPFVSNLRLSSFYDTAPVGVDPQPTFLNAALTGETTLDARALLARLLAIEQEFGRERPHAGAPRTLDLDLILYGAAVIEEPPSLIVPHPRFRERRFVLEPLAEIAPGWIDPATGLTIARLLNRLAATSSAPADLVRCPNCDAALDGRFCANCGQKVAPINPTLHDFLHDSIHEFLHIDGRIFNSVRQLFLRPGFLSTEYFAGRRASYLTSIRLYLIFSVVYFALAALAPDAFGTLRVRAGRDETDAEELRALGYSSAAELEAAISTAIIVWIPRVMFVLVPFFAALVMVVNWRSGRNYPQHLVFGLHVHAAWFLSAALGAAVSFLGVGWLTAIVQVAVSIYALAYLVIALRTAYNRTTAGALWRTAVVLSVYVLAIGGALVAIVLPVVFGRR